MTVSVGCHFRTTYLQSTSSWRENIKYTQIMKHIEKLIRYSLPEPDHYLSYGGALSIWSRTFYDEARLSWTKSFVCKKHAIRIFGCSCYDGNWWVCLCFHSLAASCASWQRRPPRWVSSPGLRPRARDQWPRGPEPPPGVRHLSVRYLARPR